MGESASYTWESSYAESWAVPSRSPCRIERLVSQLLERQLADTHLSNPSCYPTQVKRVTLPEATSPLGQPVSSDWSTWGQKGWILALVGTRLRDPPSPRVRGVDEPFICLCLLFSSTYMLVPSKPLAY